MTSVLRPHYPSLQTISESIGSVVIRIMTVFGRAGLGIYGSATPGPLFRDKDGEIDHISYFLERLV